MRERLGELAQQRVRESSRSSVGQPDGGPCHHAVGATTQEPVALMPVVTYERKTGLEPAVLQVREGGLDVVRRAA